MCLLDGGVPNTFLLGTNEKWPGVPCLYAELGQIYELIIDSADWDG
jgi:hypothetical protein